MLTGRTRLQYKNMPKINIKPKAHAYNSMVGRIWMLVALHPCMIDILMEQRGVGFWVQVTLNNDSVQEGTNRTVYNF